MQEVLLFDSVSHKGFKDRHIQSFASLHRKTGGGVWHLGGEIDVNTAAVFFSREAYQSMLDIAAQPRFADSTYALPLHFRVHRPILYKLLGELAHAPPLRPQDEQV
jgi:hypothetical protein